MSGEVVAVVPAFNPDAGFPERLKGLRRQVAFVVVVDDGSVDPVEVPRTLREVVVLRQSNAGIARALNRGILRALAERPDARFVLTVDQDSVLGEHFVERSVAEFAAAREAGVAAVATAAGRHNESRAPQVGIEHGHRTALKVAQSGMVFPRDSLERVGLFDESLVIDAVETDWCLRALRSGGHVVLADDAVMTHPVGDSIPVAVAGKVIRLRGRSRTFSHHAALRRYYITRNRVLVYPRYGLVASGWIVRDTLAEARTLCLALALGPRKPSQAIATVAGLIDGLRGRRGSASAKLVRILENVDGRGR